MCFALKQGRGETMSGGECGWRSLSGMFFFFGLLNVCDWPSENFCSTIFETVQKIHKICEITFFSSCGRLKFVFARVFLSTSHLQRFSVDFFVKSFPFCPKNNFDRKWSLRHLNYLPLFDLHLLSKWSM